MFLIWRWNIQRPVTDPQEIGSIFLSFLNIHKSAMYISSSSFFTSFFLATRLMSWSDAKKWCYPTAVALLWPSTHMFTNVFIWWTGVRLSQRKVDDPTWLRAPVPVCTKVCSTLCVPKCATHSVYQSVHHTVCTKVCNTQCVHSVQHTVCTKVCNTLCVPNSLSRANVANKKFIPYWHKIQVFSAKNVKSYFYLKYNC